MPIITCPHCGASRDMPQQRLPNKTTTARCPQCFRGFQFNPDTLQPAVAQQTNAEACVTCPHCGLLRLLPGERKTTPQATISCRRCHHSFRLEEGQKPPLRKQKQTEPRKLVGIGVLLTESWELLCRRGWSLLTIYLLASLLIATPLLLASIFLPDLVMDNRVLAWIFLLAGAAFGCLGFSWMTATLFQQLANPQLNILASLNLGRKTLGQFSWLLLLLLLTIGGGSLLLIVPGILFSGWFFFSHYILAEEGTGGLAALEKSRQLVRGHWWAVCSRFLLLLLVAGAASTLAGRLPLIGTTLNFVLTLLLVPFSLLYFQIVYEDLKRCQTASMTPDVTSNRLLYLSLPTLGWLLVPVLLFTTSQKPLNDPLLTDHPITTFSTLVSSTAPSMEELTEEQGISPLAGAAKPFSAADYDRLLKQQQFTTPEHPGVSLGPATLKSGHFWASQSAPQLWLELTLAQLPNLDLSARHSARILIDRVNDKAGQDLYNRSHSFESAAFQWVNILSGPRTAASYSGTRSIYLKQGTQAEQISRISGKLELILPIGIESRQLGSEDIGSEIQLAGKTLKLEALSDNRISLTFHGEFAELLSISASNQQTELLRDAGRIWQQDGEQISLQQMFDGKIENVTILMASSSLQRSYPFDISH